MAIEVWCAAGPPDGASFTELHLGGIDASAGGYQFAVYTLCFFDSALSIHQFSDKLVTPLVRQSCIGRAPEPTTGKEVSAIGCRGIRGPISHDEFRRRLEMRHEFRPGQQKSIDFEIIAGLLIVLASERDDGLDHDGSLSRVAGLPQIAGSVGDILGPYLAGQPFLYTPDSTPADHTIEIGTQAVT